MLFLANENFPHSSIKMLRNAGYNVESILEQNPGAKDIEVLKKAKKENRIILTFDKDYGELIYRYKEFSPPGVLYFRLDPFSPEEPAEILLKVMEKEKISIERKFTVIQRNRVRQRSLYNNEP
jgi:predicted nuclease of predicted toxin-antitoxin system